ncbi:hypothetical protein V8D89_014537 [Ganoderma adspersum]
MNLYRRCGSSANIGTKFSSSAIKALRSSSVPSRAALHTPAKKEPYPVVVDNSRIRNLLKPIPVRTLFHRWFTPEDYVDLSDARGAVVSPGATQADLGLDGVDEKDMPYLTYWRKSELRQDPKCRQVTYFPFPVNTRGFLYFWQHTHFPIASGIRFRIAQKPNVNGFLHGRDLLTPYGTPWHIPLLALVSSERHGLLKDVLQEDGYIPPQLFEHCAQLKKKSKTNIGQWSQLVFLKGQPFYLDLGVPRSKFFLVGAAGIYGVSLDGGLFPDMQYPFKSGLLSCRFETRPGNSVVMRVLRVIEPVQFVDQYEGGVDQPQPGQVITLRGHQQLFLSKRDGKNQSLLRQWQRDTKKTLAPWSWPELQRAAGEDWTFPWNVRT